MFKYLYAAVWIFYVPINLKSNDSPIFKKTDPNPQLDMSTSPSMQLGVRASKKYIDSNATYRNKNDQKVPGYVTNITEMVEDGKPSIITSVQLETAVFANYQQRADTTCGIFCEEAGVPVAADKAGSCS